MIVFERVSILLLSLVIHSCGAKSAEDEQYDILKKFCGLEIFAGDVTDENEKINWLNPEGVRYVYKVVQPNSTYNTAKVNKGDYLFSNEKTRSNGFMLGSVENCGEHEWLINITGYGDVLERAYSATKDYIRWNKNGSLTSPICPEKP